MAILDKDVKEIIDTKRDCTSFIATGLLLVNENPKIAALSAARKDQIVLYLAAHFVWNAESNGLIMVELNRVRETYRTFSDKTQGLLASRYGQTACQLDTSGTLAELSIPSGPKALLKVFPQRRHHRSGWWG